MFIEAQHLYEFGEFRLDTKEKILTRGGKPVSLTPKVFEMLCVFVENHGRLIEKEEMMQKLWAESFVEESNLTFNVRQLRVALGDSAQSPKYIQTVPRHGYRFIAEVNRVVEKEPQNPFEKQPPETAEDNPPVEYAEKVSIADFESPKNNAFPKFSTKSLIVPGLIVLLVTSLLAAFIYNQKGASRRAAAPILNAEFKSEQLTNAGGVYEAVISPDGKLMAYSSNIGDKTGVWLRQIETGENTQLVAETDDAYYGLAFSNDNRELYFSRGPRSNEAVKINIYRVSVLGGIPREVVSGVFSFFSISPDNRQISFVRCPRTDEDFCSLFVADVDGRNETKLLTRPRPTLMRDNQFSPDGKSIVVAVGQTRSSSSQFGLIEVNVSTGTEREVSNHKFSSIKYLRWLPDQSAVLVTAFEPPNNSVKIFRVSVETDEIEVLTKDSPVNYDCISLDGAAARMVTTQITANYKVWSGSMDAPEAAKPISQAAEPMYKGQNGVVFSPSGKKIVFATASDINQQIWIMNADGADQRQLTTGQGTNWQPRLSPDESYILFASNRSGAGQIWRMNPDGSNQTQLTNEAAGARPLLISSDGKTVYFEAPRDSNLGKMSISADGKIILSVISGERMFQPEINPAEDTVAYFARKPNQPFQIALMSLADGKILKSFPLAEEGVLPTKVVWSPDGKYLFYVSKRGSKDTVWRLSLETEKTEKFVDLGEEDVSDFAIAPDGKSFAFVRGKTLHDAFLITGLK